MNKEKLMRAIVFPTILIQLIACGKSEEQVAIDAMNIEIDSLKDTIESLQGQLEGLNGDCAKKEDLSITDANVAENKEALNQIEADLDLVEADYLTRSDLDPYATTAEVHAVQEKLADVEEWLENVDTGTSLNTAELLVLAAQISTNSNGIDFNSAAIAANSDNINDNATAIGTNLQSINMNTTAINANNAEIDANSAEIDLVRDEYVSDVELAEKTISVATFWTVGPSGAADYSDLHSALDAVNDMSIHPDGYLTISLEDGVHSFTETLNIRHPDGNRLAIRGNPSDESAVELHFNGPDAANGFLLDSGSVLDLLSSLTIVGDGQDTKQGVFVYSGSLLNVQNLVIEGCTGAALRSEYNSMIYASPNSLLTQNNSGYGVYVGNNSIISANGVQSLNNGNGVGVFYGATGIFPNAVSSSNSGFGFGVGWGGKISATNSISSQNSGSGFLVQDNATARLNFAEASENGGTGFDVRSAVMIADYSTAVDNGAYGYEADRHTYIQARNTNIYGNPSGDFNTGTTDDGLNRLILR